MPATRRTGFVWDERFLFHQLKYDFGMADEPETSLEHAATKRRAYTLMAVSGLLDEVRSVRARKATYSELTRVHSSAYVDRIMSESAAGGAEAGEETWFASTGHEVASWAVGGCLELTDALARGDVDNGYALVRPPGHHAEREAGRGFCLYANAALAVRHAQQVHGWQRAAVIDWDVHHGNGTEDAFWSDGDVLAISLHQDNNYPQGRGAIVDSGEGDGAGRNINVPLPPGSGIGAYVAAFEQIIEPFVRRHRPDWIVVASGMDSGGHDPLGRMMLSSNHYAQLTHRVLALADDVCGGRVLCTHEGGYSNYEAPHAVVKIIEALAGTDVGWTDPWAYDLDHYGYQELQDHQQRVVDRVIEHISPMWSE
jgi:acetoin utilization deacetylase AcuC-like enzyme